MQHYYVPTIDGLSGWGDFWIDSETGLFAACTDYGNYIYCWPARRRGDKDIRNFLIGVGAEYLLCKVSRETEYDAEETLKWIKEQILSERRCRSLTKGEAQDEWALLERYENLRHEWVLAQWYDHTELVIESEFVCRKYPGDAEMFAKELFPLFKKLLREELAQEAVTAQEAGKE